MLLVIPNVNGGSSRLPVLPRRVYIKESSHLGPRIESRQRGERTPQSDPNDEVGGKRDRDRLVGSFWEITIFLGCIKSVKTGIND